MQAGKLRRRLTLQQLAAGSPQDKPTGEPDEAWSSVVTVWGEVRKLRGIAAFTAAQQQAGIEVEIEVRYRAGVVARMRWLDGSTIYDIRDVDETLKHKGRLVTRCAAGINQG